MTAETCPTCGKQFSSEEAVSHHMADAHAHQGKKQRNTPSWSFSLPAVGVALAIVLVLGGGIAFSVTGAFVQDSGPSEYKGFAQCLDEKNATMYGAYWCPHCDEQKRMFDGAFEHAEYVECDPKGQNAQPQLCQQKGIQSYPTWIYEGERRTGAQSLESLSQWTGCELP